ncbi:uncharacterized protein N7496_007174 [Penicillium cataractarum]|uniref:Mitochondrial carrier protein pet8 n=1 Tax=Penicillium cataractarum TaxID=2100454 RepID=A0A9W9V705_9EURO|nr:uncharacterized protein N7496_007174 [Penicillium cataractarum]KAJ5371082.1 hypothetical protein N7496_007174 [Penicillium cataractarum]
MSFLTSVRASSRRVVPSSYALPSMSKFHTSAPRCTLKESDKNRDDLSGHYETQKDQQLKSQKAGQGKWNAELASNSEADVKADRGEVESSDKAFQELQQKTKRIPEQK